MRSKKVTETLVETHEVWVLRRPGGLHPTSCPECEAGPPLVAPEAAAKFTGVSARVVYRMVEAGRVHFNEASGGAVLVCLASLSTALREPV